MRLAAAILLLSAHAEASPRFENARAGLPVEHVYQGGWEHFVGGGVAVFDCNDDGYPDIFAAGGATAARLFVNRTSGNGEPLKFELASLPEINGATGAYPLDIDGDDRIDLAVLRVGRNMLLKGEGDCHFRDTTADWGLQTADKWTTAFTATWEPGNNWPTLVFGNYVDRDDPDGPFGACDVNHLYRPKEQRFVEPIVLSPGYCALSMLISDWQRSGDPELRISNDRHYYVKGGYEEMWRLRPIVPRDESDGWKKVSLWGMGIASADLTGDGLPEVMLTSMGDQVLQVNDGVSFSNVDYSVGTTAHRPHFGDDGRPSTGWHAEFGDVDNDGLIDLFIAKGNVDQMPSNAMNDPNNLLVQNGEGRFVEHSIEAGIASTKRSRGASLADLNRDGLLDIVVVNRRAGMELWQNVTEGAGNWIAVSPRQDGANKNAVGAWIEVRGDTGVQSQEVTVGGGHAGGQIGINHFGLGNAASAEIRVIWPDGTSGPWYRFEANQAVVVRR